MVNLFLLLAAITLEVCGDASIRVGLRGGKMGLFGMVAVLVICYGMAISLPSWNFSRTMGVYIAMFFIISQVVAHFSLGEHLTVPVVVGGSFIVCVGG